MIATDGTTDRRPHFCGCGFGRAYATGDGPYCSQCGGLRFISMGSTTPSKRPEPEPRTLNRQERRAAAAKERKRG